MTLLFEPIMTLFLCRYCGGLAADVTEQDVRDTFYAYGEIRRLGG